MNSSHIANAFTLPVIPLIPPALTSHANFDPHPAIIKLLEDALKMLSLRSLYARPILALLLISTRVILVERLMVTSVAVV